MDGSNSRRRVTKCEENEWGSAGAIRLRHIFVFQSLQATFSAVGACNVRTAYNWEANWAGKVCQVAAECCSTAPRGWARWPGAAA